MGPQFSSTTTMTTKTTTFPKRMLLLAFHLLSMGTDTLSLNSEMNRRSVIHKLSGISSSTIVSGLVSGMFLDPEAHATTSSHSVEPSHMGSAYQVFPDATPARNPRIISVEENRLIDTLGQKSGVLWMGEHHNAERDHVLQAEMIRKLHDYKKANGDTKGREALAIGLEQVQVQFQPILDAFVDGRISIDEMRESVEWDKRWTWPFDGYRGVFELARNLSIPLIALNVDSEDLFRVEAGGLSNLPVEKRSKYILDPEGFSAFTKPGFFKCYVEYCILPSFDMHKQLGLLQYTMNGQKLEEPMNFKRFLSGRMLWDEAMASRAFRWTEANPGGLLVGLVGADHVKFRGGIPARYDRMVGNSRDCVSMILNPSLIDTQPSGSVSMAQNTYDPDQLILQLIYAKEGVDATTDDRFKDENIGGSLPLADYIVTSRQTISG